MVDARGIKKSWPVAICAFGVTLAIMIGYIQGDAATSAEGPLKADKTVVSKTVVSKTSQDDVMAKVVDFQQQSTVSAVPASLLMRIRHDSNATSRSGFQLDFSHATTIKNQGHVIARVPLVGKNVLTSYSAVTIAYDAQTMKKEAAQETVLSTVTPRSANVRIWQSGSLVRDVYLDAAGHKISRLQAESTKLSTSNVQNIGFDFSKFNDCLSSAGVAAWVVTLISIGCSVACAVTFGLGCIACLMSIAVISGGIIGFCGGIATTA